VSDTERPRVLEAVGILQTGSRAISTEQQYALKPRVIPHVIHFKVPKEINAEQAHCIERATSLHPDWKVHVWRDPVNPDGFRLAKYWPLVNCGAQLADLIRIEIISRFGGVYLDSDVVLVKRLDELADGCEFFIASENGAGATNAAFGARAGHPVLTDMIEDLLARPPDWSLPPSITTGPVLFARFLRWREDFCLLPRESFYPYAYNQPPKAPRPGTYGIHLWAKSWAKPPTLRQRIDRFAVLWQPRRLMRAVLRRWRRWYDSNEHAIRLLSRTIEAYVGSGYIVRRTIHGHDILLNGRDVSITPQVVHSGFYELSEELFMRRTLSGGDFFVDVGANVGVFTLLAAALVGPFGRAFAYEPNPAALELLAQSAVMNGVNDRVVLRQVAVDAAAAELTVTLDSEFAYDLPIKLLKIDAAGCEAEVLLGARRLMANHCIEYIMLEADEAVSGAGWSRILETLGEACKLGYGLYAIGTHGVLSQICLGALARGDSAPQRRTVVLKCVH
jgi:hypothetical protein